MLQPGELQCPNEVCKALPMPDGGTMMMPPGGMMFSIVNCCTPAGDCGTSINNADCKMTPKSDPQCPDLMVMGFDIPSCCTSDGKCGINGQAFNMGCNSLESVQMMAMGFIMTPPPQACTPMPDAGTPSTGSAGAAGM